MERKNKFWIAKSGFRLVKRNATLNFTSSSNRLIDSYRFFYESSRYLAGFPKPLYTVPFVGQELVPVTSAKDFGVTLDLKLTFNGHIASLASSLLSTLFQINRVWHLFSKHVPYIILNSVVFGKLFYYSTVWSGTSKESIHKLKIVQNFAGRILCNTKKFDHITPVLHELGLLTTEELLCLRGVPIIFKCLNGLAPNYLSTNILSL